eukprot:gene25620-11274_t
MASLAPSMSNASSIGPRGPIRPKQNVSEAKRNAEALFENKTVSDIREIELRTRKDIESKKLQLRQLVGDSYRDLMESADQIVAIANDCGTIMGNVQFIQGGFSSLAHSFTSADSMINEKRDSLTKHEELYAVGSRIKYMIDTPEMIWGFLDSCQYLEAATRFLRAQHVHAILPKSFTPDVLAKFPLLAHQWPLVEKFKKQIVDAVHGYLNQSMESSTGNVACALAAACYLNSLDSNAALQLLLNSRRQLIKASLASASGSSEPGQIKTSTDVETVVGPALSNVANVVQTTIAQVGELFLIPASRLGASDAVCMMQLALKEDDLDSSELMFAGRSTSVLPAMVAGGQSAAAPEAEQWKRTNQKMQSQLVALTSGQVEKLCTQWVKEVSEDLSSTCAPLLKAGCSSASELVAVEKVIRKHIASWQHPAAEATAASQRTSTRFSPPAAALPSASFSSASLSGSSALSSLPLDPALLSWSSTSEWVLGTPITLWSEAFHAPFMRRAKDLVADSFSSVGEAVQAPLLECLAAAALATPEAAGELGCWRWPFAGHESLTVSDGHATPHSARFSSGRVGASPWADPSGVPRLPSIGVTASDTGFRQQIQTIRLNFDQELHDVLKSVVVLLESTDPSRSKGNVSSAGRQAHDSSASRAGELEPYVHQCCSDLTASIAAELATKLEAVGAPAAGLQGAPAAEQVLLIGRLCSALASDSRQLSIMLGPPEVWKQHAQAAGPAATATMPTGRQAGRAGSARQPVASSRLSQAMERFRATAIASYSLWSKWTAACLSQHLRLSLCREDILTASTAPPSWQENVILSSSMAGGGAGYDADGGLADPMADMRFSLPACTSSPLMSYLSAACRELCRAGDHTAGTDALQALEWELGGAALSTYSSLLHAEESGTLGFSISEKGILQLLLDVRFLRDVFLGGRPLTLNKAPDAGTTSAGGTNPRLMGGVELQDPAVAAALSARKREQSSLESQMQDRLDPIDWATYEPYLWTAVQHYYQRTSILFGSLIQLQRAHPENVGKASASSASGVEMNPLNIMPVVPRFQYLPISAPVGSSLHSGSSNGLPMVLSVGQLMGPASLAAIAGGDLASSFSFSDLGSSRAAGNASASPRSQQAGGALDNSSTAAGAFGALQARLQAGSLSSLGSILGDKAAEVTAMAQQRFDITDFSALSSGLFSGFTKSNVKM